MARKSKIEQAIELVHVDFDALMVKRKRLTDQSAQINTDLAAIDKLITPLRDALFNLGLHDRRIKGDKE